MATQAGAVWSVLEPTREKLRLPILVIGTVIFPGDFKKTWGFTWKCRFNCTYFKHKCSNMSCKLTIVNHTGLWI